MLGAASLLFALAVAVYLVFWVFVPLGRGALYDPSSEVKTELMADLAAVSAGVRCADLGSGDGRVVIALARRGAEAHGYEVNPFLVFTSRSKIRRSGLESCAFIHWGSFWSADLSAYQVVTVFQVGYVMARLERKLRRELPQGARIVSHHWRFPSLEPELFRSDVRVYRIGEGTSGPQPG